VLKRLLSARIAGMGARVVNVACGAARAPCERALRGAGRALVCFGIAMRLHPLGMPAMLLSTGGEIRGKIGLLRAIPFVRIAVGQLAKASSVA
jgi:hypothetical protein